jgi:hypothetical protein
MSTTESITGADALQALIDTKAKLARLWEWRLSLQAAHMGAERARASLEAKERELLSVIARLAADDPSTFDGMCISSGAERWIDEHAAVMHELMESTGARLWRRLARMPSNDDPATTETFIPRDDLPVFVIRSHMTYLVFAASAERALQWFADESDTEVDNEILDFGSPEVIVQLNPGTDSQSARAHLKREESVSHGD